MSTTVDQSIKKVAKSISQYIHKTPVLTSTLLNDLTGAKLYFKCENFQKTGSFKIRGATNAILKLPKSQLQNGVVTHSSGNFAQAVAKAAAEVGTTAYIVMPNNAPQVKINAVKSYGGIITLCNPTLQSRIDSAQQIANEKRATLLHPSNDIPVIQGQGTACIELLSDFPDIDAVITPVGGGGLLAGTALAAAECNTNINVYGAEPFEVDDAFRSLLSGKIESNKTTNTIADGLKTELGNNNFPIIKKHVKEIIRVTEDEIIQALKLISERLKIVVEPNSAVALAAIIKNKEEFKNKNVGIIISGGNIQISKLAEITSPK